MKIKIKGFTLMEILVVVAIIGILAAIAAYWVGTARNKAKVSRAKADLEQLDIAVEMMQHDTGLHPGRILTGPCIQDVEVSLESCDAGVVCNSGFSNWDGPYSERAEDAWNSPYYFSANYLCNGQEGCDAVLDNTQVRAIFSAGPNQSLNDSDDVIRIMCESN